MSTTTGTTDWTSGLLPEGVAADVLRAAEEASAVMSLASVRRMPSGVEWVPLVNVQPRAEWLDAVGDRKPFSAIEWGAEKLVAREVALTTFIQDAYLQDATWNPEREAEAELSGAIARAVDGTILHGDPSVAGFPPGGIVGDPVTGDDAIDALDKALAVVEASGVAPNGIIAGPQIGTALRQAYRDVQALPSEAPAGNVFGLPVRISTVWDSTTADAIVGNFSFLILGLRSDVAIDRSSDAVLTDGSGGIIVSAFEQDITVLRCHARIGCVLGRPVGPSGNPVVPFASAKWTSGGAGRAEPTAAEAAESAAPSETERRGPGRPRKEAS